MSHRHHYIYTYSPSYSSNSSYCQNNNQEIIGKDYINQLPNELLYSVWERLDNLVDLFVFGQVCRRWRELTGDDRLWSRIYVLVFGKKAQRKLEQLIMTGIIDKTSWREEFCKSMQKNVLRCQITLTIRYNTIPGQMVALSGNADALGGWDVKKGRKMEYIPDARGEDEPNWKITLSIPIGMHMQFIRLEYKYVIVDDNMNAIRWETISRRKEIYRGESVYYFRNYWNRMGYEYTSGFRHHYWEQKNWTVDLARKALIGAS